MNADVDPIPLISFARRVFTGISEADLHRCAQEVAGASRIAIISHYSPDPDAYGSSVGLGHFLRARGKKVSVINQDGALSRYGYLPGVADVQTDFDPRGFDLVITVDCGDLLRVGDALVPKVRDASRSLNIDHHAGNSGFAALNLVVDSSSSTCELILGLIAAIVSLDPVGKFTDASVQSIPGMTRDCAVCLFAGLVSDTGSFRYASTRDTTFRAAEILLRHGAEPYSLSQAMYSQQSLAAVKLQAQALTALELYGDNRVCVITVPKSLLDACGAEAEDSEGLVERGRDIAGVCVSALVREVEGIWRVSLRSRDPRYDVSEVARKFGGGGHVVAAAFRFRKSLSELKAALVPELVDVVARVKD